MSQLLFSEKAWNEYLYWQGQDKKTLRRLNALLKDIQRSPYSGIGLPEPLRYSQNGAWSRRIDEKNRIVYKVLDKDTIQIAQCLGHYDD